MTKEEGIKDLIDGIIRLEQESAVMQKKLYDRYGVQIIRAQAEDCVNEQFVEDGVLIQIYRGMRDVVEALGIVIRKRGHGHFSAKYGHCEVCSYASTGRMRRAKRRNNKWTRGEADGN